MGSPDRAAQIAAGMGHPLVAGMVKRAFTGCANCRKRIQCGSTLIDIPRAALYILNDDGARPNPSLAAKAAGKVLATRCSTCDRLDRCVRYWVDPQGLVGRDTMNELVGKLRTLNDEDDAGGLIEGVLREQGITTGTLLKRVAGLWMSCDQGKKYETAVIAMTKEGRT